MQEHLKERLTGAAILVGVVVLLVPEMFRGRPAGGLDSHAASGDGAPIRTYTIDLRDSPAAQPPAVLPAAAAATDSAVKDAAGVAASSPAAQPPAAQPPAAQAPVAPPLATSAPARSSATATAPATTTKLASSPAARSHPAAVKSGWTVQVASFTRRDFAERMVKQVRAKGFAVQAVGPDEHGLYRVRSGPISERAAALALMGKMRAKGLKPIVNSVP